MRPRVLVVDDHEDSLRLFADELSESYEVTSTTSANEALNLALLVRPALVVTDIAMPALDGYELARLLRSYMATRQTRLVAVSAFPALDGVIPPGGWDAWLPKPIEPGGLLSTVRAVLLRSIPPPRDFGAAEEPPPSSH